MNSTSGEIPKYCIYFGVFCCHDFNGSEPPKPNQPITSQKVVKYSDEETPSSALQRPLLDSNVSVTKSTHCWTLPRSNTDFHFYYKFLFRKFRKWDELSDVWEAKYQLSYDRVWVHIWAELCGFSHCYTSHKNQSSDGSIALFIPATLLLLQSLLHLVGSLWVPLLED